MTAHSPPPGLSLTSPLPLASPSPPPSPWPLPHLTPPPGLSLTQEHNDVTDHEFLHEHGMLARLDHPNIVRVRVCVCVCMRVYVGVCVCVCVCVFNTRNTTVVRRAVVPSWTSLLPVA